MTHAVTPAIELVRFRIASGRYVLPVTSVLAILDRSAVEADGESDGDVWAGWIRGPGQAIRVASGTRIFGGDAGATGSPRVIVLRAPEPVGIVIDEVIGSRVVSRSDVFGIPETAGSRVQTLVSAAVWNGPDVELWIDDQTLLAALATGDIALDRQAVPEVPGSFGLDAGNVLEVSVAGSTERFGLPVSIVRHVTQFRQPQPIARCAIDVLGLLAWQRQPVTLISVSGRLGMTEHHAGQGQIVVVGPPSVAGEVALPASAALAVGQVHGIQPVASKDGSRVRTPAGDILIMLDLKRLLENRYRGDNRATVFVSEPMPSIETVT